jgi:BirA family biotin operon repressor/biotin-[acetyl-CoA-carboxylase] ligase
MDTPALHPPLLARVHDGHHYGITPSPRRRVEDGWELHEYRQLESTNDVGAQLPAWSAVRADRQTAGRGRYQRRWISDEGGLWLSAVIPLNSSVAGWTALPLAAALALVEALSSMGARGLRLRWPNDILCGQRKLAGILIDCPGSGTAVVGIGANLTNDPGRFDSDLAGTTIRLEDLLSGPIPTAAEAARVVLRHLRGVVEIMEREGFEALMPRVNAWWRSGTWMQIQTEAGVSMGEFLGIDRTGRLRLGLVDGVIGHWQAHEVIRAREIKLAHCYEDQGTHTAHS